MSALPLPGATVSALAPRPRHRRGSLCRVLAPWPPQGGRGGPPPHDAGLSLSLSHLLTCPPLLPLSFFPSGRTLARGCRARRRQLGAPGAKPRPPPGPPRRPLSTRARNRRGNAAIAVSVHVFPAADRAAVHRLVAGRPPRRLPSTASASG